METVSQALNGAKSMAGTATSGMAGGALAGSSSGLGVVVMENALGAGSMTASPLGAAAMGAGIAAVGGAITGGLAAGSWKGAAIGAGLNAGIWSLFTLFGSWAVSDSTTKGLLGATTLVGAGSAGYMLYARSKGRR